MSEQLVSIKTVINRVYRRLNINEDLPEDDMIEWIGEALLRIGAFSQFIPKVCQLEVCNGKTELPCDFYKLMEITYNNYPLSWRGEAFINEFFCDDCKIPMAKYANDEYFMINNSYIYTSFPTGTICISYLAMPTDAEGYPMVPDDEMVLDACAKYIIYQLDYREWRKAAIPDKVFQHSEREWHWGVGAARGSLNMPNMSQMENLRNIMQRLIPSERFRSDKERKRIQ